MSKKWLALTLTDFLTVITVLVAIAFPVVCGAAGDTKMAATLKMLTKAEFVDYAIAVWDVPAQYSPDRSRIEANAKEFILARNTDGEFHIILFFDLRPDGEIVLKVKEP